MQWLVQLLHLLKFQQEAALDFLQMGDLQGKKIVMQGLGNVSNYMYCILIIKPYFQD